MVLHGRSFGTQIKQSIQGVSISGGCQLERLHLKTGRGGGDVGLRSMWYVSSSVTEPTRGWVGVNV